MADPSFIKQSGHMPRCHNPFNTYATTTTNTTAKITNNETREKEIERERRSSRRCDAIFKKIYATTERGEQIKKDSYVLCESLANYLKETTTTSR